MTKTAAKAVTTGQIIKVAAQALPNGSSALIPAHTRKAAPARVVEIVEAGRYLIIVTDMGDVMVGKGSKVTVA